MNVISKKRVGVVRGGTGGNYEESLREGGDLIVYIIEKLGDKYKPLDIFIDRNELWHMQGVPTTPSELLQNVDVFWDTTHSNASVVLEALALPQIRVPSFASLLAENRPYLEKYLKGIGVNMPKSILLPAYQKDIDGLPGEYAVKKAREVFEKFTSPWIVRSFPPDADTGIHVARTFDELVGAIVDGVMRKRSVLIEELISGKVAETHSLADFRGEKIYTLPLITVSGGKAISSDFSSEEKAKIADIVKNVYKHIGASHYLGSNFVLDPNRGIYLTSVRLSPAFKDGHFAYSCEAIGQKPHQVLEHILQSAS